MGRASSTRAVLSPRCQKTAATAAATPSAPSRGRYGPAYRPRSSAAAKTSSLALPWHCPGTRGAAWSFSPFSLGSKLGGAEEVPGDASAGAGRGDGKRWCCRARGGCAGTGTASPAPGTEGGDGQGEKTASRKAWDRICLPAERRGGGEGTAARGAALSQVSEGAGREGAMGDRPGAEEAPPSPGHAATMRADRAGRATRCGGDSGDSGHRGDTAGTSARPTCLPSLPPVSSPSLTLCMAFRIKASS